MGLIEKKTKEVFQVKGQDRQHDNPYDALWYYVYGKVDELRTNNIDNYERKIGKLEKQILTKQKICGDIMVALQELRKLSPERNIDEDEEWDDAESKSNKFDDIGDDE